MYFLCQSMDLDRLMICLNSYIYDDPQMRETSIDGVIRRVRMVFRDRSYLRRLQTTDKKWLDEDLDTITETIIEYLEKIK